MKKHHIPAYVQREAALRLKEAYDERAPTSARLAMIRKAGIDIEAARHPGPPPEETLSFFHLRPGDGEPLIGAVEFELRLEALGRAITHQCRAAYLVTMLDEHERAEDLYFEIAFTNLEVLLWEDPERQAKDGSACRLPSPRWRSLQEMPTGFIPHDVQRSAEALTSADALARADGRQSKG
ncbi:MAG: hypothetical protein AB7V46_24455 [Thermomicrobiales bacterium]